MIRFSIELVLILVQCFMYYMFLSEVDHESERVGMRGFFVLVVQFISFFYLRELKVFESFQFIMAFLVLLIVLLYVTHQLAGSLAYSVISLILIIGVSEIVSLIVFAKTMDGVHLQHVQVMAFASIRSMEIILRCLYCIFFAILSSIYILAKNMDVMRARLKSILLITMGFFLQAIILLSLYVYNNERLGRDILFVVTLCSVATIYLYYAMKTEMEYATTIYDRSKEYEFLKMNQTNMMQYYDLAMQYSEETRKLKHDLRNQLQVISLLLTQNPAKAVSMFSEMEEYLLNLGTLYRSGNEIVDTVLTVKNNFAVSNQIDTDIQIGSIDSIVISDKDLCSILTNVLDNAIEACMKLPEEERKIMMRIAERKGYLAMKCVNTYLCSRVDYKKAWRTDKEDFINHGYGLKIIRSIVEKYEGDMETLTMDNQFSLTIMLKIKLKVY